MRIWLFTVLFALSTLVASGCAAEAQPQEPGTLKQAVVSMLNRGDAAGLLAITLIFGAGIIGVTGVAIVSIIRAIRQDSASIDDVLEKLDAIESRIAAIEQASPNRLT